MTNQSPAVLTADMGHLSLEVAYNIWSVRHTEVQAHSSYLWIPTGEWSVLCSEIIRFLMKKIARQGCMYSIVII